MTISIIPVGGMPEVRPGDDLAELVSERAALLEGDVLVVTQKVVSKAEGRLVSMDTDDPRSGAVLVERESTRVLRRRGDLVISETRQGLVCANAGVDLSNVMPGWAALLPEDGDRSARRIREALRARTGASLGVIVSDTFGRPWRRGSTDVAIGCAGVAAVLDLRGKADAFGRPLQVTEVCVADELTSAAELVMGKAAGIPAAIVRGVDPAWLRPSSVSAEVVRRPEEDLFR
ncbi:MAG: coenzyme F420-0:L-glutamate ligase [Actinomycetota bacterium]|nr:coenzyme F420-0:L-glutamate ligase [Actinomycetota bacterium]